MKRYTYLLFFMIVMVTLIMISGFRSNSVKSIADNDSLRITLPREGKLVHDKPIGKNWVNLLASVNDWNADTAAYHFTDGTVHGDYNGGQFHNYAWTKKVYTDFELQALVKLTGKDPNSGICIRLHPTSADDAPGYQVDMGTGYWGCLWEERRAGMVQKFPDNLAAQLVKQNDWNHYYIIAKGHHIQAWLNGVKTIDTEHTTGFTDGNIGFQLCHGDKHTVLDVKCLSVREIK